MQLNSNIHVKIIKHWLFELYNLLTEEMKYRVKQFGKCINATNNYTDWLFQSYASKLRRRLMNFYAE